MALKLMRIGKPGIWPFHLQEGPRSETDTQGPGLEEGQSPEAHPGQPRVLTQAGWGFSGREGGNWGCARSWAGRARRPSNCKEKLKW